MSVTNPHQLEMHVNVHNCQPVVDISASTKAVDNQKDLAMLRTIVQDS